MWPVFFGKVISVSLNELLEGWGFSPNQINQAYPGAPNEHEMALALSALSLAECDGRRVEVHPLLHEYARARLHETPEHEQELIVRHAHYFGLTIGGAFQQATKRINSE